MLETLPLEQIVPDPDNPRKSFDPVIMDSLEESMKKMGIISPLHVEKTAKKDEYLLVDGERRHKTAVKMGLKKVPVIILEPMTPKERMIYRFNIQEQHKSWDGLDKSYAIQFLIKNDNLSNASLASMLSIPRKQVETYLLILGLSQQTHERMAKKRIPHTYLKEIAINTNLYNKISKMPMAKIEGLLLDKVDNRTITDVYQLRKLARILKIEGSEPKKMKFLTSPEMTFEEFSSKSSEMKVAKFKNVMHNLNWTKNMLSKFAMDKNGFQLTEQQETLLRGFKELLEKLIP